MITTPSDYQAVVAYLNKRDTRRHPHRLPIDRYTWSDCEFFITICARECGQPFRNQSLASKVIDALLWRRERHHWFLFCYCLMPDHLHFIVQMPDQMPARRNAGWRGEEDNGLLHQLADFKSYTTSQLWWKTGGAGPLWQKSSFDRIIRYNDSVDHAVSYVLNNPVRKGLVDDWTTYPYTAVVDGT